MSQKKKTGQRRMSRAVPFDSQVALRKTAVMCTMLDWNCDGKPPMGSRAGVRDQSIAHARLALSEAGPEGMFVSYEDAGVKRPSGVGEGHGFTSGAGMYRMTFADGGLDATDPIVAESIMSIVVEEVDRVLAEKIPGQGVGTRELMGDSYPLLQGLLKPPANPR